MIREKTTFRNMRPGIALCLATLAAVAFSSCSEKEMLDPAPDESTDLEIAFNVSVTNDGWTNGASTRASEVTGFDSSGSEGTYNAFGVYAFAYSGYWQSNSADATLYIDGEDVTNGGNGVWSFETTKYWPGGTDRMTFFGYAPTSAVAENGGVSIAVTDDNVPVLSYSDPAVTTQGLDLDNQYDLLVAKTADATRGNTGRVAMNFQHILTAVQFNCGDIQQAGTLSKITLTGIKYSGAYDMDAGKWTLADDTCTYEITTDVTVEGTTDSDGNYTSRGEAILAGDATLMMLPQELSGVILTVEFTPDSGDVRTLSVVLDDQWLQGTEVVYYISISDERIDIIPLLKDEKFKEYCLEKYSSDGVHVWYPDETEGVTEMDCSGYSIADFTGIEYFENLESFISSTAEILDLSKNTQLSYIYLGDQTLMGTGHTDPASPIKSLDLSANTKLETIPLGAFRYCEKLVEIALPSSCTTIGNNAFEGCDKLETVTGWEYLTEIGKEAFYDCTSLKSATFAEGLTSIGDYAFYRCSSLAIDVVLPNTLTYLGTEAFYRSGVLSFDADDEISQHVKSGALELGTGVFQGCTSLTKAKFPVGWTTISQSWFNGCSNLASIDLPDSVTTIERQAFASTGLTSVDLPTGLTTLGYGAFQNCSSLTSIEIPSGVTEIDQYTFSNCSALRSVDLPAITSIGSYAFYYCSALTSIDLIAITYIGNYAFCACSQLATMIIRKEDVPSLGGTNALNFNRYAFNTATHTLYVPEASVDAYIEAWSSYFNAITAIGE